jgi:hypothetical protein
MNRNATLARFWIEYRQTDGSLAEALSNQCTGWCCIDRLRRQSLEDGANAREADKGHEGRRGCPYVIPLHGCGRHRAKLWSSWVSPTRLYLLGTDRSNARLDYFRIADNLAVC